MHKGYIIFYTTSSAFYAEDILKNKDNIFIKTTPTPREFSSDCGVSLYFETVDKILIGSFLDEHRIEYEIKLI